MSFISIRNQVHASVSGCLLRKSSLLLVLLGILGAFAVTRASAENDEIGWTRRAANGHAMAYDSARGVMVEFGGWNFEQNGENGETWELRGTNWTQRLGIGPSRRFYHSMAYDSARGVTVLFGGNNGSNETWEWNGTVWTQRLVSGPTAEFLHSMVYDSARGVCILFGGYFSHDPYFSGETWEWDGTNWTQRLVSGPSPRFSAAMAYDSARGVTVLFGGFAYDDSSNPVGDTWEWNGTAWTQRSVIGPSPRAGHSMAYDSARGVAVLFSGINGSNETWEWNGTVWTQRSTPGPTGRAYSAMAYDSVRRAVVLYGGRL